MTESIIDKIRARAGQRLETEKAVADSVALDPSKIAFALSKIRAAGFTLQLQPGGKLLVTPRAKLSEAQVAWISSHKLEILAYLRLQVSEDDVLAGLQKQFDAKVEQITLPSSTLAEAKPLPVAAEPVLVRCLDCVYASKAFLGDETGAWRVCEQGLGGYFAFKKRVCESFAGNRP